jgi:Cu+-exporting ATPase
MASCYHCGEPVPDVSIHIEDKLFCCQGCKMVFEILNENDLCSYYDIEENAGISLKGRKKVQYAYLDDREVREQLIDFTDEETTKVRFHLPQIHCASCIWLLENLYKLNDGITHSTVNFPKKEIAISFLEAETSLRKVVELLDSIGYAPAINLSDLERPKQKAVSRRLYYQLGIAGFAFGNIMLLSFPEYLGLQLGGSEQFPFWFGLLNILLALPVVFYSGWDYLKSAFLGIKHRHLNMDVPISLGIVTLFLRSVYEILSLSGAGYLDSLAGLVFFLLIGKWFQQKTFHHLSFERDYKSYFPIAATMRQEGEEVSVPVNKLEVGDTILVKNGELIPADGLLLKGQASVDYSFVTGEADPVSKAPGEKLYAGGRQVGESIEITLTRQVSQSYLTQLWNDEAFQKEDDTRSGRLADKIAQYFTWIILTIAFSTLAFWLPKDMSLAFNAFTAVLIIACPCAVALSIPFTFGNSIRILGRNNFYLKNIHVIEKLQEIGTIVFDKTGTLTSSRNGQVDYIGVPLTEEEKNQLQALISQSAHPASRQISQWLGERPAVKSPEDFEELIGKGVQGTVDGQLIRLGSAAFLKEHIQASTLNGKGVFLQIGNQIKGSFQLQGRYRKGLKEILQNWRQTYRLFLLTGDNDRERSVLEVFFGQKDQLRFEQSPNDKLQFIKALQQQGEHVLMIGDGLNDAGALRQSDVGIVVTENTSNFTPASDAILGSSRFQDLPLFIRFTRGSIRLVYGAYFLALIYNIIGLSFAVQGTLSPVIAAILMPSSSVTIVLFGVLSSSLLARRMGLFSDADKNHPHG